MLPFTTEVDGETWKLFDAVWKRPNGRRMSFYFYALSEEHAETLLAEIRRGAEFGGEILISV